MVPRSVGDEAGGAFTDPVYWRWLLRPWKVTTFGAAATALSLLAPGGRGASWDHVDVAIASVLAFATAPYAVGALYRRLRGIGGTWDHAAWAVCLWFIATCWSHDLYLLWRDGRYALSWYGDVLVSSALYVGAGLVWSLERRPGKGITVAFTARHWPTVDRREPMRRAPHPATRTDRRPRFQSAAMRTR